jgi:hypothetical protein
LAAPVGVLALAAAGWAIFHNEAHEAVSFSCVTDGVVSVLPNDGTEPVAACRSAWEAGAMVPGVSTAPALVACLDGQAAVAVLEGDGPEDCAAADMGVWTDQPAYEAAGDAVRSALVSFHDRNIATGNGCATVQDWRAELAAQPGIADWKIEVDQIESSRHCYDVGSIDPTVRKISLIGTPGEYSIGCDPRTGC